MATLADRIRSVADVTAEEAEHLRILCSAWQVLADLSFSDLFLYVKAADEEVFEIAAQVRPFTSQTLYPQDLVGTRVTQPEQPIVERAWREGEIWAQEEPVLVDGLPIRMDAVPVRYRDRVVAVLTKEGSPHTSRRPGRLEEVYLDAADKVSNMICRGWFPWPDRPRGDWPRVGDGLFLLDSAGLVEWASPNALSALRRLGVKENIVGRTLDELHLGESPVRQALATRRLLDGELVLGDSFVLLRVMPLLVTDGTAGALVLARDVSEVRRKEREISVKDATIREIHHRVKNNLQTIASLLRLQSRRLQSAEAKEALTESVLRIGSIALVHETLSEDASHDVDFGDVVRRISAMVREGLVFPEEQINIEVTGSIGLVGADLATPLAVTVTELMQNAIEHAFPEGSGGDLHVELSGAGDEVSVVVRDNGIGLNGDQEKGSRLGLQIVRSLIEELGGRFELSSDGGTRAVVRVPRERARP
ncbi:MAG: two-component system, sensor histidine kinase PdtaS [Actinomycetota bacterium]|jgi:two-component sensor histidine kinase|nr:two-component system, sensor histidine kinase PdtaS [Actinomycetota bacterium]